MQIAQKELYERLAVLIGEQIVLAEDIKQLKQDFAFNKKSNPTGLPKEVVADVHGAAKIKAQNDYEEKREKTLKVFNKFEELEGYND